MFSSRLPRLPGRRRINLTSDVSEYFPPAPTDLHRHKCSSTLSLPDIRTNTAKYAVLPATRKRSVSFPLDKQSEQETEAQIDDRASQLLTLSKQRADQIVVMLERLQKTLQTDTVRGNSITRARRQLSIRGNLPKIDVHTASRQFIPGFNFSAEFNSAYLQLQIS